MSKDKLLKIILEKEYYNGIIMYRLIKTSNILNDIKIDEENFLELLDHLLSQFDEHFPLLFNMKTIIFKKLLENDNTKEYLNDYSNLNNSNLLNDIFTKNFSSNIKLLRKNKEITNFFDEINIKSKIKLLEQLSFTSDKLDIIYLFFNIYDISDKISENYPHYDKKECQDVAFKDLVRHYNKIIKDYNLKKDYVKYFLDN